MADLVTTFKVLLNETAFTHHVIASNASSSQTQPQNNSEEPTINPQAQVPPTSENSCGYTLFDLRLVPNYTNNQLTYYYAIRAISAED